MSSEPGVAARWIAGSAVLALMTATGTGAAAPDEPPRPVQHAVFVEAGGNALVYSLNYDIRPVSPLSFRAGGGLWQVCFFAPCGATVALPVATHVLVGAHSHHLEAGVGWTGFWQASEPFAWAVVPSIGYRLQPLKTSFFLRVTLTPLTFPGQDIQPITMAGLSVGATVSPRRRATSP